MLEGYEPSPAELGLAQDQLEAMSITERETDHGSEQVDAHDRVTYRTETWGETQQATQIRYPEAGGSVENGKLLIGPEAGKELRREHPGTTHEMSLVIHDPDLGEIPLNVEATLTTLGSTVGPDEKVVEPWAHFEVTNPSALEKFKNIPNGRRQPNDRGERYSVLDGQFGGGQTVKVNGREIVIESIGRLSVVFSASGEPQRLTIHKIRWKNFPTEKK